MTQIDQPGLTRSYTYYDETNFLKSEANPETGQTTYTRDYVGNVDTKKDANGTTWKYTFDAINRLTNIKNLSTGDSLVYGYDNADNRTVIDSSTATISITYDPVNRPKNKTETISGQSYVLGFDYDGNDNLRHLTYPNGRTVEYTYNTKNQVKTIPGFINSDITYSLASQPEEFTYANELPNKYVYNARFLTEDITAGTLLNIHYLYDSRGNTEHIIRNTSNRQDFVYDNLNRLTDFSGAWGSGSYSYDDFGNRRSKNVAGQISSYTVNSDTNYRLTAVSGSELANYRYDNIGQVTSGSWGGASYGLEYDDHSNLENVTKNRSSLATYSYDADGQRVAKTASGETIIYHYGLDGNVLAETRSNGSLTTNDNFVYLYGKLIAKISLDSDGDGVGDNIDNCVDIANADQLNTDGDSLGNACDDDIDNDGIANASDPYPLEDGIVVRPTPASLAADGSTSIAVLIDDLPQAGGEVLFEQIVDINNNGSVDTNDPIVRAIRVVDGSSADSDGVADGQVNVELGSYDLLGRDHAPGNYLLRATSDGDVTTYPFTVTAVSQSQTLAGTLTDGSSPLAGAYVQLLDKWQKPIAFVLTDSQGKYLFNIPEAGEYLVAPQAFGFARDLTDLQPVNVAAGATESNHDLVVPASGYHLSGQVTDQQSGKPISGTLVQAVGERYLGTAMTDADGNYAMLLPLGSYTVGVAVEGASSPSLQGYVVPAAASVVASLTADMASVDLELAPAESNVSGTVQDETGNAVSGLLVTATLDGESEPQAWVISDADGGYELGLTDGNWTLDIENNYGQTLGFLSSGTPIVVSGTDLSGEIVETSAVNAWIEGEVLFADGDRAAYVPLELLNELNSWTIELVTAGDGSYRAAVVAGDWLISAISQALNVSVADGQILSAPSITGPTVQLLSPNGGELFISGESQTITWSSSSSGNLFTVEYRTSSVAAWELIVENSDASQYSWDVPVVDCAAPQAQMRITMLDTDGNVLQRDTSDDYFAILIASCPPSYTYDSMTGVCVASLEYAATPCTDGGALNETREPAMCEITTPSCPAGYSYIFTRNRCEKTPECESGTYDSTLNQCYVVTQESVPANEAWTCVGRFEVSPYFYAECTSGPSGSCQARIDEGDTGNSNYTWESGPIFVNFGFDAQCNVTSYYAEWAGDTLNSREFVADPSVIPSNYSMPVTVATIGYGYYDGYSVNYISIPPGASLTLNQDPSVTYICESSEYSLNGSTCTRSVTSYDFPTCTSDLMDYDIDKCWAEASCPSNYDLILSNDLCEALPVISSTPCLFDGVLNSAGDGCILTCGYGPAEDPDLDGLTTQAEELLGTDPYNPDSDGDGVVDGSDIFPLDSTEAYDNDGDNVGNNSDNCINVANADQLDTDADGTGDLCDSDDDNDGLPDVWEIGNSLDPLNATDASEDFDGDGLTNAQEYNLGTDPWNVQTDPDGPSDYEKWVSTVIMPIINSLLLD